MSWYSPDDPWNLSGSNRRTSLKARAQIVSVTGVPPGHLKFDFPSKTSVLLPNNLPFWSPEEIDENFPAEFSLTPLREGVRYCLSSPVTVLSFPQGLSTTLKDFQESYPDFSRNHFNAILSERGISGYFSQPDGLVYLTSPRGFVEITRFCGCGKK
jgi:hypothetical protein